MRPTLPAIRRLSRKTTRLQRLLYTLRTEGASRSREAWAVGLGVFVGCSPLIGLHLAICVALGSMFGLNRLKLYLAANLVNPLILPFVLFAEVQTGSWLRRGHGYPLSLDAVASMDLWHFGTDLIVGSIIIGSAVGLALGALTYASLGRAYRDREFTRLVREASDRYLGTSMTAWEFARGKLRNDPVYRAVLSARWLPESGRLLDVGCGQGLLLALVAEAKAWAAHGLWPDGWTPAPASLVLAGIEQRSRMAELARHALENDADIVTGDARTSDFGTADVIVMFDVLHLIDEHAQRQIVVRAAASLVPGGRLLVREADKSAGWRFRMVKLGNRLTALMQGRWRRRLFFRTAEGWQRLFEESGLTPTVQPMGEGTPFANVLIVATKAPAATSEAAPSASDS
jgi:uncharacterized protein (DUF2062 family)